MLSNRLRVTLLCIITAVWAVNQLAPIFIKHYQPPPELNAVFGTVAGSLVASWHGGGRGGSGSGSSGGGPN